MKSFIKRVSLFTGIVFAIYFICKYYEDVKKPGNTREFYANPTLSAPSYGPLNFEGRNNSVKSVAKSLKIKPEERRLDRINVLLEDLDEINKSCEDQIASLLPPSEVLDPEGQFFSRPDVVEERLSEVVFTILKARKSLESKLREMESIFTEKGKVPTQKFYSSVQSMMLCLSSDVSLFLESTFESSVLKGDKERTNVLTRKVITFVDELILNGVMPDALLFSLNVYRVIGETNKFDEEYFNELNSLYDKISTYEESFFSEFSDEEVITDPNERLELYLSEMKLLYEEFNYVRRSRLENYLEAYQN